MGDGLGCFRGAGWSERNVTTAATGLGEAVGVEPLEAGVEVAGDGNGYAVGDGNVDEGWVFAAGEMELEGGVSQEARLWQVGKGGAAVAQVVSGLDDSSLIEVTPTDVEFAECDFQESRDVADCE
jgi:hypothetical protein